MPVSVIVDDGANEDRVYVLDPGNSRIKCLAADGKFLAHLGECQVIHVDRVSSRCG